MVPVEVIGTEVVVVAQIAPYLAHALLCSGVFLDNAVHGSLPLMPKLLRRPYVCIGNRSWS